MKINNVNLPSIKDISQEKWDNLAQKKIYFGHQSVGFNIMDGVNDILKENQHIKLNIVETNDPDVFVSPVFAHSKVGQNKKPKTKIEAFEQYMEMGIGNKADIAFFKFCYVDANADTDIDKIFMNYKDTMLRLKSKFPETKFIHVTMPITAVQKGVEVWIKKVINRPIGGYADNIKRHRFNEMLRAEYKGKEPIYDLAEIESTYLSGKREIFTKDEKTYYAMIQDYAFEKDLGRHLNELGRKIAAERLLDLLVNLEEQVD